MKSRKTLSLSRELLDRVGEFRWKRRIESFSKALETIVRYGLQTLEAEMELEDGRVEEERRMNNRFYSEMRERLLSEYEGKYIVIANGRLLGSSDRFEDAFKILRSKAPNAKHAIIDKVEKALEVSDVWEGILEKLK